LLTTLSLLCLNSPLSSRKCCSSVSCKSVR